MTELFDAEEDLKRRVERMRRFMTGIYSPDRITSDRQGGIECDACGVEVPPGKVIHRLGIYLACGPCAIQAAQKIKMLVELAESDGVE